MATRLQRLRRESVAETFRFAGPAFRRAAPWLLAAIAFVGLATRLHPTLRFAVWGSDSGEYVFLTRQLVDTGRILFPYDGWGLAYPYFPGMFTLSGAVHAVLGVDLFRAVLWATPIVAATVPALVGLLSYRMTSDPRVGVVAGAFVAVCAGIVITTSHAMPGTLGQVFLFALLALLPEAYRERRSLVVLLVFGAALLVTHHLTTYFAAGILAMVPFYREMTQRHSDVPRLRVEVPLALAMVAGAAVWWLFVAEPFREQIVGDALDLNPWVTTVAFLAALGTLPFLVWWKRQRSDWHQTPRYHAFPRQWLYVMGCFLGLVGVLLFLVNVKLPGTDIDLGWATFWYALPLIAFISFLPLGLGVARFYKQGNLATAALLAILASLAFAVVTNSRVLFPFRHVDYMLMLMAPFSALGMLMVYDQTLASRIPAEQPRARANLATVFVGLLLVSAALSLPPRETLGGFEEGVTDAELAAIRCVARHPEIIPPGSAIAADHRVSSLLWGLAGLHATWDYTPRTYHAESADDVRSELAALDIPAGEDRRVDFVFLSPPIEEGVTLVQWETSAPMSAAAVAKFEDPTAFEKVYDHEGVRIYHVLWDAQRLDTTFGCA